MICRKKASEKQIETIQRVRFIARFWAVRKIFNSSRTKRRQQQAKKRRTKKNIHAEEKEEEKKTIAKMCFYSILIQ